ncbi:hypothetical protein RJ641_011207 [Dillenia turbinata]|uniref:Sugar phosphate transporter domain-containing protein n=1 Tax=Dillenia turbinata TaxID=194707 RepID=A0AAN8V7X6_9MAGN
MGFYQIAKLSMIPVSCLLEVVLDNIQYSRDTKLSIALALVGVGVCTVTDVSVNRKGFIAAFITVWSTRIIYCPVVHHCNRNQSQPIHMHWEIHICMVIVVMGMIWYGNASSKLGGKEHWSPQISTTKQQKYSGLSESTEDDEKVQILR